MIIPWQVLFAVYGMQQLPLTLEESVVISIGIEGEGWAVVESTRHQLGKCRACSEG